MEEASSVSQLWPLSIETKSKFQRVHVFLVGPKLKLEVRRKERKKLAYYSDLDCLILRISSLPPSPPYQVELSIFPSRFDSGLSPSLMVDSSSLQDNWENWKRLVTVLSRTKTISLGGWMRETTRKLYV